MVQQHAESQDSSVLQSVDAIADDLHKHGDEAISGLSQASQGEISVDIEAVIDEQQTALKSSSQILAGSGSSEEVPSGSYPTLLSRTQSTLKDKDSKPQPQVVAEEDEAGCLVSAQDVSAESLPHLSSTSIHGAEAETSGGVAVACARGESKPTLPLVQWPPPYNFFGATPEDYDACCESFWCPCVTAGRNAKKAGTCSWLTVPLCCLVLIHYALLLAGCFNGYWLFGCPVVQLIIASFLWINRRRIAEAYDIQATQDIWPTCFFLCCGCWFIPLIQESKVVHQTKVLVGESVMLSTE